MVAAYAGGDAEDMQRINKHYGASYSLDDVRTLVWRRMYKVRQAKGVAGAFQLPEAQEFIARTAGFSNWSALLKAAADGAPAPGEPYSFDRQQSRISVRRIPSLRDWDRIIGVMKERRIVALEAEMMTDEALKRIAELEFVTSLSLGGSHAMSDDGMQYLAHMPQLGPNITLEGTKVFSAQVQVNCEV